MASGKGVKVGTAYVEILGDFSGLDKNMRDALNKAGTQAARPVGKKIGKDLATGIDEGMKTAGSSGGGILSDIIKGKSVGGSVRDQAKKVGKEVGKGIDEGIASSGAGKGVGTKIGRDIGKEILDGARKGARDAGVDLDKELVSAAGKAGARVGQAIHDAIAKSSAGPVFAGIQEKIDKVTDFTGNATDQIKKLNDAFTQLGGDSGQVLDGLRNAGGWLANGDFKDITNVLSNLKGADFAGLGNAIKGLQGKDIADGASKLSEALKTLGQGGAGDAIATIGTHTGDIVTNLKNAATEMHGFADSGKGLDGLIGKLEHGSGAIGTIVATLGEAKALLEYLGGGPLGGPGGFKTGYVNPDAPWKDKDNLLLPKSGQGPSPTQVPGLVPGLPAPPGVGIDQGEAWRHMLGGGAAGGAGFAGLPSPASAAIAKAQALSAAGTPYMPGVSDCSGYVSQVYSAMTGGSTHFTTESFNGPGLGFVRTNQMIPGALVIGIKHGGPGGGHMAATLPNGVPIESGGGTGGGPHYGGGARGGMDDQFTEHWVYTGGAQLPSYDTGSGELTEDQIAQLHKGEVVLPADQVAAAGGHPGVNAALANGGGGQDPLAGIRGSLQDPTNPQQAQMLSDFARTIGYLPAAGATGGVAGTSSLAGLFSLGNQAVGGAIDIGASAAETAINMGISAAAGGGAAAGTMGAGAAAAPIAGAAAGAASNYAIQLGATEAKRVSSYLFQLGAIGSDALVEQLFPFGAPRWLGYDYTQFLPQLNISQVGVTTAEKAVQAAMSQGQGQQGGIPGITSPSPPGGPGGIPSGQQPGGPVSPDQLPGSQVPGPPTPQFGSIAPGAAPPEAPKGGTGTGPEGGGPETPFVPGGGPAPTAAPGAGPITSQTIPGLLGLPGATSPTQPFPSGASGLGLIPTFDDGGVWQPGTMGANMSGRPELVLSPSQMDAMSIGPAANQKGGDTWYVQGLTASDVMREADRQKRLDMMRHSGRPYQ